jgi:hypothetical protein
VLWVKDGNQVFICFKTFENVRQIVGGNKQSTWPPGPALKEEVKETTFCAHFADDRLNLQVAHEMRVPPLRKYGQHPIWARSSGHVHC